ncbi:MAG: NAD(P)H-dependent oxidoreductase [Endomicrobia bacterium]|nr:NAD(P)H-dependent oxidoreductase [Endomicrobiia bacterium]
MKILTLIGGISKNSINKKFFEIIKPLAPKELEFDVFDISGLPYFSQDTENDMPEIAADFKNRIASADAVLVITPEYNRSMPGVLKNALDYASRPYGKNVWIKKPTAVLGTSPGATGAFAGQQHAKNTLSFLGAIVMWQPEIYFNFSAYVNDKGELADSSKKVFENYFAAFKLWIEKNSSK